MNAAQQFPPAIREDLAQLKQGLAALNNSVQRSKADTETAIGQMDRRASQQFATIQKSLADLSLKADAIEANLGRLEGRLDETRNRLDTLSRSLEPGGAVLPPPGVGVTPAPTPAPPSKPQVRPSDVYQQAYLDFSKGNYILAMAGFSEFLRLDPTSDLADNAQFWIGEAYYSQKQFERAVQEYQKVYINYPKGDKVPAALFKEALAHLELRQQTLAQARLQYLVEQFPHSEEAALARDRLARLKSQR